MFGDNVPSRLFNNVEGTLVDTLKFPFHMSKIYSTSRIPRIGYSVKLM